jgi:hypothetical protein
VPNPKRPNPHPPPTQNGLNSTFYRANPFSPLIDTKPNHLPHPASNPSPATRPLSLSGVRNVGIPDESVCNSGTFPGIKMRNSFILSMAPTVHYSLLKEKSLS